MKEIIILGKGPSAKEQSKFDKKIYRIGINDVRYTCNARCIFDPLSTFSPERLMYLLGTKTSVIYTQLPEWESFFGSVPETKVRLLKNTMPTDLRYRGMVDLCQDGKHVYTWSYTGAFVAVQIALDKFELSPGSRIILCGIDISQGYNLNKRIKELRNHFAKLHFELKNYHSINLYLASDISELKDVVPVLK